MVEFFAELLLGHHNRIVALEHMELLVVHKVVLLTDDLDPDVGVAELVDEVGRVAEEHPDFVGADRNGEV